VEIHLVNHVNLIDCFISPLRPLSKSRQILLTKSIQKDNNFSVTCITTFTPRAYIFKSTIIKYWHILTSDTALTQHFKDPPLFVFKRGPNLQNKLVRANNYQVLDRHFWLPSNMKITQCHNTWKTNTSTHPRTGHSFPVRGVITCYTKNVIYMLKFTYDMIYIGETIHPLKQRISEHKSSIRRNVMI